MFRWWNTYIYIFAARNFVICRYIAAALSAFFFTRNIQFLCDDFCSLVRNLKIFIEIITHKLQDKVKSSISRYKTYADQELCPLKVWKNCKNNGDLETTFASLLRFFYIHRHCCLSYIKGQVQFYNAQVLCSLKLWTLFKLLCLYDKSWFCYQGIFKYVYRIRNKRDRRDKKFNKFPYDLILQILLNEKGHEFYCRNDSCNLDK